MANTYTQIFYHIVFSTKDRSPVLAEARREELFRYVWGIHQKHNCHLYRMNGVDDHVHILTSIHPSISLSDYIREIKTGSSLWIKRENVFPGFAGWQDGYGAFTHSIREKASVIDYIKRQKEHHQALGFLEEYKTLLEAAGVEYDERYLA